MGKRFVFPERKPLDESQPPNQLEMLLSGTDISLFEYYERRACGKEPPPDNRRWPGNEETRHNNQCMRRREIIREEELFCPVEYNPVTPDQDAECTAPKSASSERVRRPARLGKWTFDDEEELLDLVQEEGIHDWSHIAKKLRRKEYICQEKYRQLAGLHLNILHDRNPWSAQEDADLLRWVEDYETKCWIRISHFLQKSPEVCKKRYHQIRTTQPEIKAGNFQDVPTIADGGNIADGGTQRASKRLQGDQSEIDSGFNFRGYRSIKKISARSTPKGRYKLHLIGPKANNATKSLFTKPKLHLFPLKAPTFASASDFKQSTIQIYEDYDVE